MKLAWFKELARFFNANLGTTFLVHGNINDYFFCASQNAADHYIENNYKTMRDFLKEVYKQRKMIIFYNISEGITFADSKMEEIFREIVGWKEEEPKKGSVLENLGTTPSKKNLPKAPCDVLPLLEKILRYNGKYDNEDTEGSGKKAVVIVEYPEMVFPNYQVTPGLNQERADIVTLLRWAKDQGIKDCKNLLLLLISSLDDVSEMVRAGDSGINKVAIMKPDYDERLDYVKFLIEERKKEDDDYFDVMDGSDLTAQKIANLSGGLNLKQIEEIFLLAEFDAIPLDAQYLIDKKKEIFNQEYADILEFMDTKLGFDTIGGLDYIAKDLMFDVENMKKGETKLVSMGITLMGPPGTGKTAIAEALAAESGLPCLKIRNMRHWLVGKSEARGAKAFEGIAACSPCIVVEDEADQSEQSRDEWSGDSGVSNRLRQMRFEFTSDTRLRGKVLWIRITNRPDKMDEADMRSGRSDKRIPVLLPEDLAQIADIYRIMPLRDNYKCTVKDFSQIAEYTKSTNEYISGADIQVIMRNALIFSAQKGHKQAEEENIKEAIDDFIPTANERMIDFMTYVSLKACSSKRLQPKNAEEITKRIEKKYEKEGGPQQIELRLTSDRIPDEPPDGRMLH